MAYTPPNYTLYKSTNLTDLRPAHPPRKSFPLPTSCPNQLAAYALTQDFEAKLVALTYPPLNTKATDAAFGNLGDANAIATSYTPAQPTGFGLGKLAAQFHIVPASWDDFKLSAYTFPGFPGLWGSQSARDIFTDNVLMRVHYDYFVIDPTSIISSVNDSGGSAVTTVASLSAIPIIPKTNFVTVYSGAAMPATRVQSLIKAGGDNIGGNTYLETLPNREYYQKWVANAAASGWASSVWDGVTGLGYTAGTASTVGQFVIEDSHLEPFAGNIIARVTTYCLAK
jgi:hypothetical protein